MQFGPVRKAGWYEYIFIAIIVAVFGVKIVLELKLWVI